MHTRSNQTNNKSIKRELLLLVVSITITLVIAIAMIRWLAPQLLGGPTDMQLVQLSKEVPPFYEGVFRKKDFSGKEILLKDPLTRVRAKPLYPDIDYWGPNDLLGFRNRSIPNVADVVIIGDSQTYGNNATLEDSIPGRLQHYLSDKHARVYSMATGGWGAIQYFDIFQKALLFQPNVIVVAFYTGNDPLESFSMAYGSKHWHKFRPNLELSSSDAPSYKFPAPPQEQWNVQFKDGVQMTFSPKLRLITNSNNPAVKAGYDIMFNVARLIAEVANQFDIKVVYTIIPTAELVYAKKIEAEGLEQHKAYQQLITYEQKNLDTLAKRIKKIPKVIYIDVTTPLQEAALGKVALYPDYANGHPIAAGYDNIAKTLNPKIDALLPSTPEGLVAVKRSEKQYQIFFVSNGTVRRVSEYIALKNGWSLENIPIIKSRKLDVLTWRQDITSIEPDKYGPQGTWLKKQGVK
jgi:lysophospholipase L1-like esterase